ncbi:MAG: pyridoxamine 5'-phosphate oxidase family protein [Polyangiaceae bacterium]
MSPDPAPDADHAVNARAVCARARVGALSTLAREPAGFPYGSIVELAFDERGRPILLLSRLAEHTQNLLARPEASIVVFDAKSESVMASARVTLLGPCAPILEPSEARAARELYLAAHANARVYADFADFGFYRLEPVAIRYIGGFGKMSWVSSEAYSSKTGIS